MAATMKHRQSTLTKAGAIELDENALDDVSGGPLSGYLKIEGLDGESKLTTRTGSLNFEQVTIKL